MRFPHRALRGALPAVAAGIMALGLSTTAGLAETWDMPTPYPDKTFHTVNIAQFAADVAEATDGALTITVHSAGSLFPHAEIKNAVRRRLVPIGEFYLSRLSNEDPVFATDSQPFLATTYDEAERLWAAQRPAVEALLANQGLKLLYAVPWPPQGLYTKTEVNAVSDLEGLKFRAYNATLERFAQLVGAAPTQVEVPDIPQAFATGRVEAMMTSPSTGANSQAWDYVNHFYHVQGWIPKNVVVVNLRSFGSLAPEVQAAVIEAAAAAEARGLEMSKAETEEKLAILEENGMTVHREPSVELMQGLKAVGAEMLEEWKVAAGELGAEVLAAYGN